MKLLSLTLFTLSFLTQNASALNEETQKANEVLIEKIKKTHDLSEEQIKKIRTVFSKNKFISQGNPKISKRGMSQETCQKHSAYKANPEFDKICGTKYMAPLYNPKKQKISEAKVCIDQFEYPSIPCEYPLVWTTAQDAADICAAMGKRLCDTHEWEGACAGELLEADYKFELVKDNMNMNEKHKVLRSAHNPGRKRLWSYGPKKNHSLCATSSHKSKGCNMNTKKAEFETCGSNFYPAGAFPKCKSSLDVYDIHGNVAEAMNIPFQADEMASKGGLGYTELKGSWYIFNNYSAHQDDCRWRAPFWHGNTIEKSNDQHNHLGFRCCKDVK